jgi:hypothetical protein
MEYTKATAAIDPDACSRCYDRKSEGYFEGGRFVRKPNRKKLRERCDERLNEVAPVCAECGDELRIDAEMQKTGVLTLTKILLTALATAFYIIGSYAIAAVMERALHWRESASMVLSLGLASWLYFMALGDIWHPDPLSITRRLYEKRLRRKRSP